MTREENLHWINEEIRTWENECQSKHPIKEALYAARKVLEQEPRKGKWTKLSNTVPCMNCPICGSTFTLILGGDKMHYCPNCGADMREGE